MEPPHSRPLMRHDPTVISLGVFCVPIDLAILIVVDDALVALVAVVGTPVVRHAALLERERVAAVVGRAVGWEVQFDAFGVVAVEGFGVFVSWDR